MLVIVLFTGNAMMMVPTMPNAISVPTNNGGMPGMTAHGPDCYQSKYHGLFVYIGFSTILTSI